MAGNKTDIISNANLTERRKSMTKTIFLGMVVLLVTGCASTANKAVQSAGNKNLNLDGYLMYGDAEFANPETGTPVGKLIIGRLTYKSRKVGIPADQKVPTTGYFKATKTKSLFGTEEQIIEYDFTAGSDAEAAKAFEQLNKLKGQENETQNNSGK
jgi:hypothetical protein